MCKETPNQSDFTPSTRFLTAKIMVLRPNRPVSSDSHLTSCHSPPTSCQVSASLVLPATSLRSPQFHLVAPGKKTSRLSAGHNHHSNYDLSEHSVLSDGEWRGAGQVPSL